MKKRLLALITGAALVGTLLAGCGSTSENTESPDAAGNTGSASGGGWPSGPVSIVVPASAGGGTDLLARVLAEKLTAKLGQSFVVVNVTGAGGSSGINQVHEAAPDGNTILFFHNALLINNVTGVSDYSYEGFAVGPHVVTDNATGFYVSADAPYSTYPELIDYCKEHPGEVTMGVEVGGFTYMMVKSFEAATGVQFNLVDVGSNSDKCTALLGGHIDIMPNQYSTAKGYIESGDFVALGFPAEERSAVYPDVPTAKEQGVDWLYNGYEFGFFLPKDTPKDIQDTPAGTMMHSHNIVFEHVDLDYAFSRDYHPTELLPPEQRATFQGFVRPDGWVATRNYIGILVASNCAATVARKIANHFTPERLAAYPNVSGVVPFVTGLGCGMEMTGPFMDLLRRTIMGYATNPNLGAAIVTALGCERNNIDGMFEHAGLQESETLQKLVIQDVGGTAKAVEEGIRRVEQLLPVVNACRRQTVSAEHLVLALECGGSDGFSGLSANPALGRAVDLLVKNGGTAILSETTEIFGVEHTLTRRARTPEVGQKLVDHINWWLKYNEGKDCQINGRVSPGNNKGGLANVLEKSLGGAKKGGETALNEVYDYAEKVTEHGLVFMNTPGYDPVATTGQVAGGATMVAFTTGRGSCFGGVPSPVLKLASNTPMYQRMEGDMDINCGVIIDGEKDLDEMGQLIFERILQVASGDRSKSELLGVGENEFVPWPIGVLA